MASATTAAARLGATTPSTKPNVTPEQAAEIMGVSRGIVLGLMDQGRLKYINIGIGKRKHRRTSEAWIQEFESTSETTSAAASSDPVG